MLLTIRQSPVAYSEFNTTSAHQSQVFGAGIHKPGEMPLPVTVRGASVAVWIPAEREILTTDAQPDGGGAFITVSVGRTAPTGISTKNLARVIAEAAFAARPDAHS